MRDDAHLLNIAAAGLKVIADEHGYTSYSAPDDTPVHRVTLLAGSHVVQVSQIDGSNDLWLIKDGDYGDMLTPEQTQAYLARIAKG